MPINRYYHWCFCDNFEWIEGDSARFGLVHINYASLGRTVKQSGRFYTRMIKEHGVSKETYSKYVEAQEYHK